MVTRLDEVYSEATTRRQIAAVFKDVDKDAGWARGSRNGDIGGGAWDEATRFLHKRDVDNVVYDPGNRSWDENHEALRCMVDGQCDTVVVANVLNVIPEDVSRSEVIELAANCLRDEGVAYFSVYEGYGDGKMDETRDGFQNNAILDDYADEVAEWFDDVQIVGRRIEARAPVKASAKTVKREYDL